MTDSSAHKATNLQTRVYSVVSPRSGTLPSRLFNGAMSILILLSVAIIVVNTFSISHEFLFVNLIIQAVISIVFTIEYLLRLWTSPLSRPKIKPSGKARLRYFFSVPSIIDLLAILPFWLFLVFPFDVRFLGVFRVLRIMRLLRIGFYAQALKVVGAVLKTCIKQLVATLLLVLLLLLVASILMYNAEHAVQPEVFEHAFSGFWWAMQTITTIGYGDIYPVTLWGQFLGCIIALLGIGMIAIPTGIISAAFVAHAKNWKAEDEESL